MCRRRPRRLLPSEQGTAPRPLQRVCARPAHSRPRARLNRFVNIVSTHDFRHAARRHLPRFLFEYLDGGANDELTLRRNVEDLERIALNPRVLRDVSQIDLKTSLFGQYQSMPVILGPVGISGLCARRGERQAAQSAWDAGIPFTLSTVSICSIEEVAERCSGPLWFQLYVIRDRAFMRDMLARARRARAAALVFTVDMPAPWADLDWLRQEWEGPLIIKGILNPEDARSALRV